MQSAGLVQPNKESLGSRTYLYEQSKRLMSCVDDVSGESEWDHTLKGNKSRSADAWKKGCSMMIVMEEVLGSTFPGIC